MSGFVGVHLGAGDHAINLVKDYQKASNRACRKAMMILEAGGHAVEACAAAVSVLEDTPLTNAGYGSNCNWEGTVECDASIMDGHSLRQGAVGAVSGVKNPITLAQNLCMEHSERLSQGLVPPSLLVGDGARAHAERIGIELISPESLVTEQQRKRHEKYRSMIEETREDPSKISDTTQLLPEPVLLDTVGAVCVDSKGHVASACSSGGILLKPKGRVGQAGIPGAGCWAQDAAGENDAIAISSSGCGEQLVRTFLVKEMASAVQESAFIITAVQDVMRSKYMESPLIFSGEDKQAGLIVLKYNPNRDIGEFLWTHSTKTMCVGFMSSTDNHPTSRISMHTKPGQGVKVEGCSFQCRSSFR